MRLEEERDLGGRNAHRKKTGWGHKGRRHKERNMGGETRRRRERERDQTDTTGDTYAEDMTDSHRRRRDETETRKHEPEIQINLEA